MSLGLATKSGFNMHIVIWTVCVEEMHRSRVEQLARLPFSQGQAAVRTTPPTAIKTKTRGVTWMVNRTHMIWIIQTFEILKWQLFFQNAFVGYYSSAPSLKMNTKNTTACRVPFHYSMPSFMNFRRVFDLLEFKNQVSQSLRPSDGGRVFDIHSHFLHGT